jgi:hypothetical protein
MKTKALAVASLFAAACGGGGSKQGAMSPSPTTTSAPSTASLSAEMTGTNALDVTGPAFAKYDPTGKMLVVLLFDASTDPTPSCDLLDPSKPADLKKGTIVTFQMANVADAKAGSYPLAGLSYVKGDQAKGDMSMGGGAAPAGSKFAISQMDASSLVADVADPKTGKSIASIHATVCKAGSLTPGGASAEGPTQTGTTGAGSYIGPGESGISIAVDADHKQETSGNSVFVKLDPKTKTLAIIIADFSYQPAPTCDHLAIEPEQMGSGLLANLTIKNFPARAKGKFPVTDARYFNFMNGPSQPVGGPVDGVTIDIAQFDDTQFRATVSSAPTAKIQVSAEIGIPACPDGTIDWVSKKSKSAKGTKKKKK